MTGTSLKYDHCTLRTPGGVTCAFCVCFFLKYQTGLPGREWYSVARIQALIVSIPGRHRFYIMASFRRETHAPCRRLWKRLFQGDNSSIVRRAVGAAAEMKRGSRPLNAGQKNPRLIIMIKMKIITAPRFVCLALIFGKTFRVYN